MKVLITPKDPTLDAHILGPIVVKLFDDLGRQSLGDERVGEQLAGRSREALPGRELWVGYRSFFEVRGRTRSMMGQ